MNTDAISSRIALSASIQYGAGFPKTFWVVTRPEKGSVIEDILFESDMARMELQFKGGLKASEIYGVYGKEAEATKIAKGLLK